MRSTEAFRRARDFLLRHRADYDTAYREFRWPDLDRFNWALDWFDVLAEGNRATALHIVEDDGREVKLSYGELAERSNRVAVYFRHLGVQRGDRILMMLPNSIPIWEVMLAAMKLGAVIIPATSLLTPEDLRDRLDRGRVRHVVTDTAGAEKLRAVEGSYTKIVVGEKVPGWMPYEQAYAEPAIYIAKAETLPNDPVLLYFTSGTTAKPELVLHTHASYPVGHLSTMYWLGVRDGDVHMNISSPGWGKHAWSNFYAPLNAGATVFVHNYARRLQELRLPHLAVRAGERAHRVRGDRRSGGRAEPRPGPRRRAQGLRHPEAGAAALARAGAGDLPLRAPPARALQARPPHRVLRLAEDHLREDPTRRVALP
jgi:acetyl-CoA synthetase